MLMMLPLSWAVGQAITHPIDSRWKFPAFVGISALAMTAWDMLMDPMMVSWRMWEWENPVGYFGIPWKKLYGPLFAARVDFINAALEQVKEEFGAFDEWLRRGLGFSEKEHHALATVLYDTSK